MHRSTYDLFRQRCNEGGAINDHLPLLHMLSLKSEGVAEFGVDRGVSGSALIAGQEERVASGLLGWYYGVDRNGACKAEINRISALIASPFPVEFIQGNTQAIEIIPIVDMLLIDAEHTETAVRAEINRHSQSVRKYIALHDTVTFGENGDVPNTRGVLYGITELHQKGWRMIYNSPRNNGLLVFERA